MLSESSESVSSGKLGRLDPASRRLSVLAALISITAIAVSGYALTVALTASRQAARLSTVVDFLTASATGLEKRITDAESTIELQGIDTSHAVDLTETSLQDIGDGFNVGDIALTPHLTGVKVRGRIVNGNAVEHRSATFELTVDEQRKQVVIQRLRAGGSAAFDVYVPDVAAANTRFGQLKFVSSTVRFFVR